LPIVRPTPHFELEEAPPARVLRLRSGDGMNRLTRDCVAELTRAVHGLAADPRPLVIAGNDRFFSTGADLNEIAALNAASALEFSRMGRQLMHVIEHFPAEVVAAIAGYCMGGGLDLALACHRRIAAPGAIFGHRGAALGLITGWGGTQRLPRVVGRSRTLQMLVAAEKVSAHTALAIGLIDAVTADPVAAAIRHISTGAATGS